VVDNFDIRTKEALIRGTVWAFIGSLYGIIFIFFYSLSNHYSLPVSPFLIAGTLAGTLAALIYSSMSLAVIIASVSSVTSLIVAVSNDGNINLLSLVLITALVGALVGAWYGVFAKHSRVFRADAKTLTGICSGGLVSLCIFIVNFLIPSTPLMLTIGASCLLTGSLYVVLVPIFVQRYDEILPAVGDGAMVGAGTSVFIALLFFVMISGVTPEAAGELKELTDYIRNNFLQASAGGMLGGGIAGFASGMMLKEWQDL
jgi:hypothetical protein